MFKLIILQVISKWIESCVKIVEKKYYRDIIISHKDNTKTFWSIIESILNKHRKLNIQCKFKLNNGILTDDKKLY